MASWYIPPAFVPVKYVPASQKDELRAKEILHIHAAAREPTTGPYAGGLTNHWCLYLQTGTHESVRIDVAPNPQQPASGIVGGSKADVVVSLLSYVVSGSAVHVSTMNVPNGLAVGQVIDFIVEHGLDKYEFTAEGVGCRRWISNFLTALGAKGWLTSAALEAAKNDIGRLWPNQTPLEIGDGGYY